MNPGPLLAGPALWWRLLVIGGLWGTSFPLLRMVAAEMSPFALAACRGGFAALAVVAFLAVSGQLKGGFRRYAVPALVLGTCNGWVPNLLTAFALGQIEAAPAALIHASTPLLVALIAVPVLRDELPGWRGVAGLALGFCGIAVIIGPDALAGGASLTGGVLILVSCVSYATGTVYARRARLGGAPQIVLGQQVVAGLVAGLLSVPFGGAASYVQPGWVYGVLAVMGILASALPLTMFLRLVARARVTDAAMVGYIQPPFAAGMGAVLLGEWPSALVLVGGAVVLAGVWLGTSRR
jgi:drug/metabolite transporter (DMT)-like permease